MTTAYAGCLLTSAMMTTMMMMNRTTKTTTDPFAKCNSSACSYLSRHSRF